MSTSSRPSSEIISDGAGSGAQRGRRNLRLQRERQRIFRRLRRTNTALCFGGSAAAAAIAATAFAAAAFNARGCYSSIRPVAQTTAQTEWQWSYGAWRGRQGERGDERPDVRVDLNLERRMVTRTSAEVAATLAAHRLGKHSSYAAP